MEGLAAWRFPKEGDGVRRDICYSEESGEGLCIDGNSLGRFRCQVFTDSYPRTRSSRRLPIARSDRLAGFPRFTFSQHNIRRNRCGSVNSSAAMEKHWMRQFTERLVRFHLDFMNPILQLNPRLFGLGMSRVRPRNMVNSGNLAPCKDRASLRDEVSAAHNL